MKSVLALLNRKKNQPSCCPFFVTTDSLRAIFFHNPSACKSSSPSNRPEVPSRLQIIATKKDSAFVLGNTNKNEERVTAVVSINGPSLSPSLTTSLMLGTGGHYGLRSNSVAVVKDSDTAQQVREAVHETALHLENPKIYRSSKRANRISRKVDSGGVKNMNAEFTLMNTALNMVYGVMNRFPEPQNHPMCTANIPEEECVGCHTLITADTKKRNYGLCNECRKKETDNYKFDLCG